MQNAAPKQPDQLGFSWRAGRPLEGDQLQAEVSSLIVGGLDTTAQTCAFTMFVTPQPVASCNRTHQGTQEKAPSGASVTICLGMAMQDALSALATHIQHQ